MRWYRFSVPAVHLGVRWRSVVKVMTPRKTANVAVRSHVAWTSEKEKCLTLPRNEPLFPNLATRGLVTLPHLATPL
jgi:hypothetical protein